jgi:hypothetical protein
MTREQGIKHGQIIVALVVFLFTCFTWATSTFATQEEMRNSDKVTMLQVKEINGKLDTLIGYFAKKGIDR